MQAHGVGCCLVEDDDDVIEAHQLMIRPASSWNSPSRSRCEIIASETASKAGTARRWPLPAHHPEILSWRMPRTAPDSKRSEESCLLLFAVA